MRFEINPRIEGKLVERVMHSPKVKELLDQIPEGLEIDKHALVKSIIITSFNKFEFNLALEIEKIRNHASHQSQTQNPPQ